MEEIKEKMLKMAADIEKDIENLRKSNPEQLMGAEIMALNALCKGECEGTPGYWLKEGGALEGKRTFFNGYDTGFSVCEKLYEYEKTGITPGQIREISEMYKELATELGKYKKAEEQGLLIMLPCKEGDMVYSIEADCGGDTLDCRRRDCENCDYLIRYVSEIRFGAEMREEIGKTVFLTREEAEKALKEMEG